MTDLDMFIDYKGKIKSLKDKLKTLTTKKKEEKNAYIRKHTTRFKKKIIK